ncbi:MAG TPA: STAS domain-containing protein [Terriglobales bacterium]
MSVRITNRKAGDVAILDMNGRIIFGEETGQLREAVHKLLDAGTKKILLNLADVSYIDSTGVGELVGSLMSVRKKGGELKLMNLTQKVKDVVNVTKLYTIFDIKDDEFTALKSFDNWFFAK